MYEIVLLWGSTVAMGVCFYHVNSLAGWLTIPYLAWATLATALNYTIYKDNKPSIEPAVDEKKK